MGRFTLFILQKIILITFLFSTVWAREVEGVKIPSTLKCAGLDLPLQGYGLRKATIFGIKIYVLALYSSSPITKVNDPNLENRPICMNIYYLKNFDNKDVDRAWDYQFKESSLFSYGQLNEHIGQIKAFFGEIKDERLQSFHFHSDKTEALENNKLRGTIEGKEFQKNFLNIFFGTKPPTTELRDQIFKNLKD